MLKKGNKVYLYTKNLKIKKSSKKLNHVKVESFLIKIFKEKVDYELKLSQNIKIHSIFHVNLLKLIDSNTFIQDTFHYEIEEENEWKIEKILKQRNQQYLIKWKKYFTFKNTWESLKNLKHCQAKLREFRKKFALII